MSDLIERLNRQHERVRDPFAIKKESSIFSEAVDLIEQQAEDIVELKAHVERLEIDRKRGADDYSALRDRYDDLMQERNELVAHVGRLRDFIKAIHAYTDDEKLMRLVDDMLNQTPQQSLADRDAEVARKAFIDGFYSSADGFNGQWVGDKNDLDKLANEYAERVKRGEL